MSDEKFVYVIYIAATQEKVWKALLDGEMTRQWLGTGERDRLGSPARNGSIAGSTRPARLISWAWSSNATRPGGSC